MAETALATKPLLVVFEGEGTLWCRIKGKKREPNGVYVQRGSVTVLLRPGLHDLLTSLIDINIDIGFWTKHPASTDKKFLPVIIGPELHSKLIFEWFQDRTQGLGAGIRIKESALVAAEFKDFGYQKLLFVDHDYFSHASSLPGNLLLVREFKGRLPDVFLETWVWEIVKATVKYCSKPGITVPHFMFNTKRPRASGLIAELIASSPKVIAMADTARALVDAGMTKWHPDSLTARKDQEAWLNVEVPHWREAMSTPNLAEAEAWHLDPIVSEQAWDLWEGTARELAVGDICNLTIHTSGEEDSIIATGKVISIELPDFAMIEVQELKHYGEETAIHYVMRWRLRPGRQVRWLINYLFPVPPEREASSSNQPQKHARTFLTPAAKQRPGMARKDRKLEPYQNIIWPRIRNMGP